MNSNELPRWLELHRRKSGDLVVAFHPEVISPVGWFKSLIKSGLWQLMVVFQTLDNVTGKRTWLALGLALFLGISSGLFVFSNPQRTLAEVPNPFEIQAQTTLGESNVTELNFQDVSAPVTRPGGDELQHQAWLMFGNGVANQENGSSLIQVAPGHYVLDELEQARLGDKIEVIGQNNGRYQYVITEIRELDSARVSDVVKSLEPSLVVAFPTNFFRTQTLLLIARPPLP